MFYHSWIIWHCSCNAATHHYNDVIMSAMASEITSLTIVYSAVYSGADQRKHQSSASLAGLCAGNSPVTGEFPAQRASNEENVSIWWRNLDKRCMHIHVEIGRYIYLYIYRERAGGDQSISWFRINSLCKTSLRRSEKYPLRNNGQFAQISVQEIPSKVCVTPEIPYLTLLSPLSKLLIYWSTIECYPVLLTWFNFNPSMDT